MEDLENQILIVLEKEYQNTSGTMAYFLSTKGTIKDFETYDTLIDIYSNIQNDATKKRKYIDCLLHSIKANESIHYSLCIGYAHLSVYTLIKLGYTNLVMEALNKRVLTTFLIPVVLNSLANEESKYFSDADLSIIKEFCVKQMEGLDHADSSGLLRKQVSGYATNIVNKRYENLKKSIKSINLEINLDKKVVGEKVSYLGFDPKFTDLLNEIDIYINTDTSKFVNAAMISNLRVFMEDIFKDIAKKISDKLEEPILKLEGKGEMGNIRAFIKRKLDLHDNEHKFLDNFINILHSEGGHSFTSEKEYFRLARNIAIEIALLLLSKYEKKYHTVNPAPQTAS